MSSELTCDNNVARTISGVSMLLSWENRIDIHFISSGERNEQIMRRYRTADVTLTED